MLAAGGLGISALALPGRSTAASAVPTSSVADTFTLEAVADRTVRVTWSESGFTDTIEYRAADADPEDAWTSVGVASSPADVVTVASWSTTATERDYEFRIITSSGGVSLASEAKQVTSLAAATGGDVVDLAMIAVGEESVLHRVHTFTTDGDLTFRFTQGVDYLIVGGEVVEGSTTVTVASGTETRSVVVGAGGPGGLRVAGTEVAPDARGSGGDGGTSSVFDVSAAGGGGGGNIYLAGRSGGSGGGGGSVTSATGGDSVRLGGADGSGTAGGRGSLSGQGGNLAVAGGGGGAGDAGSNADATAESGGAGRPGRSSSIT